MSRSRADEADGQPTPQVPPRDATTPSLPAANEDVEDDGRGDPPAQRTLTYAMRNITQDDGEESTTVAPSTTTHEDPPHTPRQRDPGGGARGSAGPINNEGIGGGATATTATTVQSALKIMATRIMSPEQLKQEFRWQERAGATARTWEKFRDEVLIATQNLDVFVYMADKSPFLQVVHSIAKFFDRRAGPEINNSVIGFVGERTQFRDPHPVILPVRNTWAWTATTAVLDEAEATAFYEQATDKRVCWVPRQESEKQQVLVPRMVFLPSPLAKFVLLERRTAWEMRVEIKRMVEDGTNSIDGDDAALLLEWMLVASQSTSAIACTPAVQLTVSAVLTECEVFARWAYYRLEHTLGKKESTPGPVAQGQGHAAALESARAIQGLAESVQRLAAQQQQTGQGQQENREQTATRADTTALSPYGLAALMGWCNVFQECDVPPIWARLLATKETGDHRAVIMAAMSKVADDARMEFDNRVYFSDKTVDAVVKLQPNPGDAIPNFESAGKGLSMLACRPKSTAEIEMEKEKAAAEKQTKATRTLPEALQLEKGDSRLPATTFDQLKKNLSMFTLWNKVLWGGRCDFATKLEEIYQVMLLPAVSGMDHKFTPMLCKQITWAVIHDKCNYFHRRLLPDEFKGDTPPSFPKSLLDDVIPKIMFQETIHRSTFPRAWEEAPTASFAFAGLAPPSVANPFAAPQNTPDSPSAPPSMAHVHPWIAHRMKEYHARFKGRVMMSKILTGANITFERLPIIQEFINRDTKKNELCYNHVMGTCSNRRCWYRHASKAQIPNSFAGELINLCGPGIDYVVRNEPQGWGRGQQTRRGDGGYYGRATVGSGGITGSNGGGTNNGGTADGSGEAKRMQRENQQRYGSPEKQPRRT